MAMFALATESARAAAAEDRRGADGIRRAEGSGGWRRRRDGHVARARCGAGEPDAGNLKAKCWKIIYNEDMLVRKRKSWVAVSRAKGWRYVNLEVEAETTMTSLVGGPHVRRTSGEEEGGTSVGRVKSRDNGKRQKWDSLRPLLKKFASNGHTEHLPFKVVSGIIRQLRQVARQSGCCGRSTWSHQSHSVGRFWRATVSRVAEKEQEGGDIISIQTAVMLSASLNSCLVSSFSSLPSSTGGGGGVQGFGGMTLDEGEHILVQGLRVELDLT
uniref:Uncharacterized protein n=1 Tax=Oryza glaberrima TaxID=4538 RepID=I1PVD5_ORYGL